MVIEQRIVEQFAQRDDDAKYHQRLPVAQHAGG